MCNSRSGLDTQCGSLSCVGADKQLGCEHVLFVYINVYEYMYISIVLSIIREMSCSSQTLETFPSLL